MEMSSGARRPSVRRDSSGSAFAQGFGSITAALAKNDVWGRSLFCVILSAAKDLARQRVCPRTNVGEAAVSSQESLHEE
jgi:hypothetical protein